MSKIICNNCIVKKPLLLDTAAPDFYAEGYYSGKRIDLQLSNLRGMWIVLFFYAADFTFV